MTKIFNNAKIKPKKSKEVSIMTDSTVRLSSVSIQNFKNIKSGQLNFLNPRKNYKASILGLYGQNGSGKTTLVDALQLLKYILCGKPIPQHIADYINVEADYAALLYTFDISTSSSRYKVFYECRLRKEENIEEQNIEIYNIHEKQSKSVIFDEVLSYSFEEKTKEKSEEKNRKLRKSPFIDTRTEKVFIPVSKYECLVGKNKEREMNLFVAKKIASHTSRSFIFSGELINAIRSQRVQQENNTEYIRHLTLLENLIYYGNYELFVIRTANNGMISMNTLPLAFKYQEQNSEAVGQMMLPLDTSAVIPKESVEIVKKVIYDMNIVLNQIVPGLTISLKNLGVQILENGKTGNKIQLMSQKNSREIPLKYESEGIKKIISILQLFIVIYNQSSITVVIDELDTGIFEYLLGEILRVISEKGKGQLIFTSHNLRPLETLDRGFIAFTTTNPLKRYIRLSSVKENNNLRDFYFRDIVLGEQQEEIYKPTNNAEIAMAFREAGEISAP